MSKVAKASKHAVPNRGTQESIQGKRNQFHIRDARRNRNKLADHGNQASHESRYGTVFSKVVFGLLNLARIQQQEMSQAAIRKFVYNRTSQKLGQEVIDISPNKSTETCKQHDKDNAEFRARLQRLVSRRWHHQF